VLVGAGARFMGNVPPIFSVVDQKVIKSSGDTPWIVSSTGAIITVGATLRCIFRRSYVSRERERFLPKNFLSKKNEALRFCGRRLNEGHCILQAGGCAGANHYENSVAASDTFTPEGIDPE
jgi:hypothetical protein